MTTEVKPTDLKRWPPVCGLSAFVIVTVLVVPTAAQDDEEPELTPSTQPAQLTVREMAEQMDQLEQEIDRVKTEVAEIQKGRLAEITKEMAAQFRILSRSRATGRTSGSKLTLAQQKELNRLRREFTKKLAELKKQRDEQFKKYKGSKGDKKYKEFRKKVEQEYEKARDDAQDRYKQDVKDLKKDGDDEDPKAKRKEAEDQLNDLRKKRIELNKKVVDLRRNLPKKETALRALRDKVAAHPKEAWEAGLRLRFGRYQVDEQTGELAVRGGTWGHPRDDELWKRSNASQAESLLALATQAKGQGKADLARTCLQRILDEFPDSPEATKARTLMGQMDKPAGK